MQQVLTDSMQEKFSVTDPIRPFIDGIEIEAGDRETIPVVNPATEATVAHLCMATPADLSLAIDAAQRGFSVWRSLPAATRGNLLHATADLIRNRISHMRLVLTREQGKTLAQAEGEIVTTAAYFDELANCAVRLQGALQPPDKHGVARSVVHEPIGPVFAVSPWNLPAMMPGRKIATSLAAGCSVIVKPAKETPQTAYLIAKCCQDAGVPDGVVNVISGKSSLVSETLIASPVIRKVSFTGSTDIGKMLAKIAGAHMKKVTMELGGHAPVIVCEDVDIDDVINTIVPAKFSNAGQSCMAATRLFVHDEIYESFVESFTAKTVALRVGSGEDAGVDMGPLTSDRRLPVMENLVADAVACGAMVTTGGKRIDRLGYFFEPTVLSEVPASAVIMQEEPFGPLIAIARFTKINDVIDRANNTAYGLAAYVFSHDIARAQRIAGALDAGLVGINTTNIAGPTVPFGGVRDSGIGREGAMEGVLESMTTKAISITI